MIHARDLFGSPVYDRSRFELTAPQPKRTVVRHEAAALVEVMLALKVHPAVAWVRRMNTGAIKTGERFVRFGWPGCPDVIGQLRDGRFLGVECKAPKGRVSDAQAQFLALVREFGGVAFVARDLRDVKRELSEAA